MGETIDASRVEHIRQQKPLKAFYAVMTLAILATISIGFFIFFEMFSRIMTYIPQPRIPPLSEFYPYQIGLTMLFAFGIPLGIVALYTHAMVRTEPKSRKRRGLIAIGFLLFALVILVPGIFRWGRSRLFFGVGGFLIVFSIIAFMWFSSHYRANLNRAQRSAFDFKFWGYLCFGIVTWHICGFSNAPAFALFPDKMIEMGVQPFAFGQLKSIMAYFVVGWILTAIGYYKSLKIREN